MMANIFEIAKGNKTYIASGLGLLTAVAGYFTGEMGLADAIQTGLISLIGIFLRSGMATEIADRKEIKLR
jgi:hypothetical protein